MDTGAGQEICRSVVAKIVKQQEWIELLRLAEAESAFQMHPSAFQGGLTFKYFADFAVVVHLTFPCSLEVAQPAAHS